MVNISVIITSYNVENYIRQCLDSVLNQSFKDIEIICIDDCSSDNTYKILEDYKSKYGDKIKLFKNDKYFGGPSIGQNKGINLAKGKYLCFLDSDDYIDCEFLKNLYDTAEKYNSDIVSTLNISYIENSNITTPFLKLEEWKKEFPDTYFEGESNVNIRNLCYDTKEFSNSSIWNKIFRTKFILENNIKFSELFGGTNDFEFFYKCILNYPKTSYNHNAKYYHRMIENSLFFSTTTNENIIVPIIQRMNNLLNYCIDRNIDDIKYLKPRLWFAVNYRFKMINNKSKIYDYIHKYALSIEIDKTLSEDDYYNDYILIRGCNNYSLYSKISNMDAEINDMNDRIYTLFNQLKINDNWIKLFGIYSNNEYLIIVFCGIRITFKINEKFINGMASLIPYKSLREKFISKFY